MLTALRLSEVADASLPEFDTTVCNRGFHNLPSRSDQNYGVTIILPGGGTITIPVQTSVLPSNAAPGSAATLGIRPENVALSDDGPIAGEITAPGAQWAKFGEIPKFGSPTPSRLRSQSGRASDCLGRRAGAPCR